MALPPILGDYTQQSSILITERANPLVCLRDTFSLIFYFLVALSKRQSLSTTAALVWHWWLEDRYGTENQEYPNLLDTPIRNHPKASALLFLGSMTQAIKIFSYQGVVWPKVLVAIYLSAYCIPVALLILAKSDFIYQQLHRSDTLSFIQRKKRSWSLIFSVTALGLCCWTLAKIVLKYNYEASAQRVEQSGVFTREAFQIFLGILGVALGGSLRGVAIFYYFIALLSILYGIVVFTHNKPSSTQEDIILSLFCILYIALGCVVTYFVFPWIVTVEPGPQVAAALYSVCLLSILLVLLYVAGRVLDLVAFGILKVKDQSVVYRRTPFSVVLASTYLLVALLHFAFLYDTSGTVKPQWTELLG